MSACLENFAPAPEVRAAARQKMPCAHFHFLFWPFCFLPRVSRRPLRLPKSWRRNSECGRMSSGFTMTWSGKRGTARPGR